MLSRTNRTTVLMAVLLPVARAVDYCCKEVVWDKDWCTRLDCHGQGCQPGASDITCSVLSDCVCSGMVGYKTKMKCTVVQSCALAAQDVGFGKEMVQLYGERIPSIRCIAALTKAVCAYHFPLCSNDIKEHNQICSQTCKNMESECGTGLPYIAMVGSRCQNYSGRANEPCTSEATGPHRTPTSLFGMSFLCTVHMLLEFLHVSA